MSAFFSLVSSAGSIICIIVLNKFNQFLAYGTQYVPTMPVQARNIYNQPPVLHTTQNTLSCTNCGNTLIPGDVFCDRCGHNQTATGASGQTSTPYAAPAQPTTGQPAHVSPVAQTPPVPPIRQPAVVPQHTQTHPVQMPTAPRQPAFVPPVQTASKARMLVVFLLDASVSATPYFHQMPVQLGKFLSDANIGGIAQNALDVRLIRFNDSFEVLPDLSGIINPSLQSLTFGNARFTAPIREAMRIVDEYALSNAGAYKPWVIMISSSDPADDISAVAVDLQNKQQADKLRFMALSVDGKGSASLKKLTDVVFMQNGYDFASFFDWIGKCMRVIMRTPPNDKPQLPQLEGNVYRDR